MSFFSVAIGSLALEQSHPVQHLPTGTTPDRELIAVRVNRACAPARGAMYCTCRAPHPLPCGSQRFER